MSEVKINRKHKDRLFHLLFGKEQYKENVLSLYNAINHTNYVDVNELNIYGSKLLKLPTPQYIVFYNGSEMTQDEMKLKLSDSFQSTSKVGEFEWTATVKNINLGHNKELMESCKILKQYAQFVEKIRRYRVELKDIVLAVEKTIKECITENILADFLIAHRAEVIEVCLTEYDEEFVMNALKKEYHESGFEEGRIKGFIEAMKNMQHSKEETMEQLLQVFKVNKESAENMLNMFWDN